MKTKIWPLVLWLALAPAALPTPAKTADIYDDNANGATQIADALTVAHQEHKHVLLQFGANWCIWCHRLHDTMLTDPALAAKLQHDYVFVLIDVNDGRNKPTDAKYGHPASLGLPALVVLDAEGKQLTTQDSGALEQGDHHDPLKVMTFLEQWAPKPARPVP